MNSHAPLQNRNILLGVTGGIAAYKSAELLRLLRKRGATVRVVMTQSAQQFMGPLTFQALSGHQVYTSLFESELGDGMGHIELARWADLLIVAPATADFMARHCHGRADDLLVAICRATDASQMVAPAMNQQMWLDAATQQNVAQLQQQGIRLVGPNQGSQACGESGPGRMVEPEQLVEAVEAQFESGLLQGEHLLITAGPTREPLDPVRFLTNRSSGKMGFAIARAAVDAGAKVTLIAGPVALETPTHVHRVDVEQAEEMADAVTSHLADATLFIATAAVADYRPAEVAGEKIKKGATELQLKLVRNRDILAEVAAQPNPPFTVGFAAETERLRDFAQKKRQQKQIDLIAANRVGQPGTGFDADENTLSLFWEGGEKNLEQTSKQQLARQLITVIAERMDEKSRAEDS
ncbi:MAG: bifunctional phosphopantothenoylcysteine decarboxylase/phosphopantothenate--cysteine ligase CoaBC [Gammaproteobacteria bacterium]|jgi:phosphopantothenoylcysteine decarboxylase/phosphopantothenate--cysteine ligase|nr:bifunctional phosphopantothenoylcysteine decarboxylase/phosphopantothenate--cysteine ligase CoaBC [Gammaproteobacteria bacterium]MBT3490322.1 bifunctional phosphopantothenoylcysteine decarboxylase/phosphopantothenate--cysteine ligase CoaBC [Gammaproteobacteria bacterium]MBT3717428.1 bifunctional phosphopantothenoylcysteine decarboxylase/phosphopantothenate--cysteine ligase CoaBC [Gammaproteobacteria bacterium]MBT3844207.1 bifunctional phosphopantothenoylcysteine decarboxylase/phosphopantothen